MSSSSNHVEYVEVQLELGHRAAPKTKPTPSGYTHDWQVFVRGPDDCKVQNFIEKVIFVLHESFPKPRRVMKEPPYVVEESGYAGFELPVEIYFKNKDEPKKITFEYDLFLNMEDSVSNIRREKLTFQDPSPEFKKKLLKAGGVCHEKSVPSTPSSADHRPGSSNGKYSKPAPGSSDPKKTKYAAAIASKDKSHQNQKLESEEKDKPSGGSQFTDLFGPPIQARPSPDPRSKEASKSLSGLKANPKIPSGGRDSSPYDKDKDKKSSKHKSSSRESGFDINRKEASSSRSSLFDDIASKDRDRETIKRVASPAPSSGKGDADKGSSSRDLGKPSQKRRRSSSSDSPPISSGSTDTKKEKDTTNGTSASKSGAASTKSADYKKDSKKYKPSKEVASNASNSNSSSKVKDVKKESSTSTIISFSNNNSTGTTTLEIKSVKKEKTWDSETKKSKNKEQQFNKDESGKSLAGKDGDDVAKGAAPAGKGKEEPNKSSSNSSNKHKAYKGDKSRRRHPSDSPESVQSAGTPGSGLNGNSDRASRFDDAPLLSSPSSGNPSPIGFSAPNRNKARDPPNSSDDEDNLSESSFTSSTYAANRGTNRRANNRENGRERNGNSVAGIARQDKAYLNELITLQKKIEQLGDRVILQKIVDVIESNATYQLTSTTFDFDLMKLDRDTISRLKRLVK